jgi:hypothetical protein
VAVNIAVAWTAIMTRGSLPIRRIPNEPWPRWVPSSWPTWASFERDAYRAESGPAIGFGVTAEIRVLETPDSSERYQRIRLEAGFPLRSFSSEFAAAHVPSRGLSVLCSQGPLRAGLLGPRSSSFPVWPVWPGFLVNALLYAGVIWGVRSTIIGLSRRFRKKLGHCGVCGYDLAGLVGAACPECGNAVGAG